MRRVDLAERCSALGWPSLTHVNLGYIETGRPDPEGVRRREVTADEIVILAAALGVPPIDLVIPTGHAATVELIPGRHFSIDAARRWFDGTEGIEGTLPEALERLRSARGHDLEVEQLRAAVARYCEVTDLMPDDPKVRARARQTDPGDARRALHEARRALDRAFATNDPEIGDAAQRVYDRANETFRAERALMAAFRALFTRRAAMRAADDVAVLPALADDVAWVDLEGWTGGHPDAS
jgi:hypothetical protein